MKKFLSLLLVFVALATGLVACSKKPADYELAIGVVVGENLAGKKITETVAAIVTDKDGKIVLCRLDSVTYEAKYDDAGALQTTAPISNVAQGDDYDKYSPMPAGSWYKQGAALEKYVIGKTQTEVAAIALEGGKATDAELKAGCSIGISDLLKAIDNAFKSAHKVAFKATADTFTAGLSVTGSVKDTAADDVKNAKYTANFSATVLADGKVVAAIIDTAEAELKGITDEGAASLSFAGTKRVQGDDYDKYSPMPGGRWYAQADAFAATAIGKTAADIATLATEGVAGCTMTYSPAEFKAGIEAAVKAAR